MKCLLLTGVLLLSGCSLLTIKSPEIPLTPREQEARLLTRDYAAHFATTMIQLMDEASRADGNPAIQVQALRLKLGSVTEITRASTGLSPVASLLDTWAFAIQLRDFLGTGAGSNLLGDAQDDASRGAQRLAEEADTLAHKVSGADYARYQSFVAGYAQMNPLSSADCARPSVLSSWIAGQSDTNPLRAEGTVAQALGDVSDRIRIYSERVPPLGLWQAQLALDRAGFDDASYHAALQRMDSQLERISKLAETSPELAHEAIADLRQSLRETSDRLDRTWMETLRTVREERAALAADIAVEREGATVAFDQQRERITKDASDIAARAVDTSWRELRKLVREAILLALLAVVLLLGLPFAAGYLVGRRRAASR